MSNLHGLRVHITGIVQGVGYRPFVYELATRSKLRGWVRNTSAGLDIEVDGTEQQLEAFVQTLMKENPPLARLDSFDANDCPPGGFSTFEILPSESIPGAFIPISPDVSICDDCLQEMLDPADRRYLYPFINCTNCGPRFTIIVDIPYDRPKTTMAPFEMCQDCRTEYEDPLNRRFHAQPVACPKCGPHVWLENKDQPLSVSHQQKAINKTHRLLTQGKIIAIKGLGGFHLACDATNSKSVSELRQRKLRVDKPFALMMPDIETIERYCLVNRTEYELLISRERPIVLLEPKPGTNIAPAVAPGQNTLGVMLPYSPLHYLLFNPPTIDSSKLLALVMTSGNLSEEPIAYTNDEAKVRLQSLADAFLMHNRRIHTRCDDSVFSAAPHKLVNDRVKDLPSTTNISQITSYGYPLRRSRGYAPKSLQLPWENTLQILATGTELKNTFCLTKGKYAFLSHHIGDMENYETLQSFENGVEHFERLFRIQPEAIACDLHPDYLATRYALARAKSANLSIHKIQHHHAHIAACMADNNLIGDKPVIGVSFDGTGFGDDEAIWGGEFLLADYKGYQRFAHLAYSPLPGGDAATRKPARIALAQLWQAGIDWDEDLPPVNFLCGDEMTLLRSMLEANINCPLTSSMGRLFDAVAALTGVRGEVNYEGQAAIEFEALADPDIRELYPIKIQKVEVGEQGLTSNSLSLDPSPMFKEVISDLRTGTLLPTIAAKFHNGVASIIAEVCQTMRYEFEVNEVALSGGVWQNRTLLKKSINLLERSGFTVFIHHQVPTNDGGLALGQAVIASHKMK
ncbi:carbamoyltransferase HypF [Chloroflexota bacterium]